MGVDKLNNISKQDTLIAIDTKDLQNGLVNKDILYLFLNDNGFAGIKFRIKCFREFEGIGRRPRTTLRRVMQLVEQAPVV